MRYRVLTLALGLAVSSLARTPSALAAGYTLDDIVAGAARGLPEDALLGMVGSPATPWAVDGEGAIKLLRSGVSVAVISALTGGAHPTPTEIEASKLPGPSWADAPVPAPPPVVAEGAPPPGAPRLPEEAAPPASEYQRYIYERVPEQERTLTNRYGERYHTGNELVLAGVGETALGLGVLAALAPRSGGENPGLRLAGTGLVAVGTGSVLVGSLAARAALHDDGYRVTPAPAWVGVGFWGLGATVYTVDALLIEGELRPLTSGGVLVATGTTLGLVQAMVNVGERRRQLAVGATRGWVVTPLADARTPGVVVSGAF